jgi:diguanylate cyclase (GGDEF)-like protein
MYSPSNFDRCRGLIAQYWPRMREALLLAIVMIAATFSAYRYDLFSSVRTSGTHDKVIDLDELLALSALLVVGLLILCWRLLQSQRREVERRAEAEREARILANQDSLTGLPNRRQFDLELRAALAAPPKLGGAHAVMMLDLNDFKIINDVYGHAVGDEVLIAVSRRLESAVRDGDLVARFGGDEFAILARQLSGAEEATNIALRIIRELEQPVSIGAVQHRTGVGVGVAMAPADANDASEILRKADIALYRAKSESSSALSFFEESLDVRLRERDQLERELRNAISNGTVQSYYQPLIDLKTKKIVGFEALARWIDPKVGNIPPDRFIPIAESCGLMRELTDLLFKQAVRAACNWPKSVSLSFNISPSQFRDRTLGLRILSVLGESGLSPNRLEIEITEAALVGDLEGAQAVVKALREAGVRIALDDFGTGYSSLYHLRNFKVDKLKIDRSFIKDMGSDGEAAALVRGLLGLGHGLGLIVTAEGVEQASQAQRLSEQGCEQAQGYLYGKAMTERAAIELLALSGLPNSASA